MSSPAYYMPSLPSNCAQRRTPGYPRLTSAARRDMPQVKRPDMTSLACPDTKSATSLPSLTYLPSYMSSLYQSAKANALHGAPSGFQYQAHAPSGQLYQANKTNKEYAPPRMAYVHDGSPYVGGSSYVGGSPYIATNGLPYIANKGLPLAARSPHVANLPLTDNALKPASFIVTRRPQYPRSEGYYSDEEEEAPSSGEEGSPMSSSSGEVFSSPASSSEEFFSASEDEGFYSSASSPASNHVSLNDTALIPSPDDHLIDFKDDYLSLTEDDANAALPTKINGDRSPPGDERDNSEDGHSNSDESTDSEESADPSEELADPEEERRRKRGMKRLAIIAEYARQAREEMRYEEAAARGSRVVPAMCAGRAPSAKNLPKAEVRTAMVAFIASRGEGRVAGAEEARPEKPGTNNDATFSYSRFAQLHAQRARLDYLQRARATHKASHAEYVQRHAYLAQLAHLEARNLPRRPRAHHPAHPDAAYVSPRDLALQGPPPVSRAQIEWEVREGGPGAEAYRTAMWVQYQQARAREAMAAGA